MPGKNPREAVGDFLEPIGDSLACVARAKIRLSRGGYAERGKTHGLTVNNNEPVSLKRHPALMLQVMMQYEIIPNLNAGQEPWRVTTRAYNYELQTASGQAVVSYHWHPTSRILQPHMHLGATVLAEDAVISHKAHNPTGRISLESIIRACIAEYGVEPLRDDWDEVLSLRERQFRLWRSWS